MFFGNAWSKKIIAGEGKGARSCPNCKNEKNHNTGKQPEGVEVYE
jgi:hypothetical protein